MTMRKMIAKTITPADGRKEISDILKEVEALLSLTHRDVLFSTVWTQAHPEIEDLLEIYKVEGLGTREQLKLKLIRRMCLEENVTLCMMTGSYLDDRS